MAIPAGVVYLMSHAPRGARTVSPTPNNNDKEQA